MLKKLVSNMGVVLYPLLLVVLFTTLIKFDTVSIAREQISYFDIVANYGIYFLSVLLFLYVYMIHRISFSLWSVVIGLLISISCTIPQFIKTISSSLYSSLFQQSEATILVFGITVIIYIGLIFVYMKNRMNYRNKTNRIDFTNLYSK
ncbi:putative membrane protein [Breznakia sp. PF5-3]|uniref:hypothetical protein n=1 Tax=unclassified Breznakia TaxID=2623764 RepID=UPI00240666C7|nr:MULTISPECIES: hypothetical protein [unclassified Breznakia]MDF9824195.1 putative membrane protein [Breznakia sp. PM6-1]MDF9834993.1 putative membrane protein [Breznakia sp. PF5-3]MDF9837238.1 putative membrane protein [Breznakia sp. PFB2-8]MDF9859228.1 putative membrane protein [Breznakia sp. PH5-24]